MTARNGRLAALMFDKQRSTAADHDLIDLLADARGDTDEQRAAAHWQEDNPPAVGSEQWIREQAELYLLIEEAERENERLYREISGGGGST